ncbi:MAG: VCBS repeat-containing protein [Myxococcales bacterium]
MAAADLDGNGSVDLALSGNVGEVGAAETLINDGHGVFSVGEEHTVGVTSSNSVDVADLDGDDFPEIVVANPGARGVSVLQNRGDGTFAEPAVIVTDSARGVFLADLNGDSWVDMAVLGTSTVGGMMVLANDRHGGFVAGERFLAPRFDMPIAVVSGDFNEDGARDLATAGDSRPIVVWLNAGAAR